MHNPRWSLRTLIIFMLYSYIIMNSQQFVSKTNFESVRIMFERIKVNHFVIQSITICYQSIQRLFVIGFYIMTYLHLLHIFFFFLSCNIFYRYFIKTGIGCHCVYANIINKKENKCFF